MRHRDLASAAWRGVSPGESAPWAGLELTVEPREAGLRVELARQRRMRVTIDGRPLLWSCVVHGWQGIWVLGSGERGPLEAIAPVRATEARAAPPFGVAWWRHQARFFADALGASARGPLREGRWTLRPSYLHGADVPLFSRAELWDVSIAHACRGRPELLDLRGATYESWGINGSGALVALRAPSPPDAPRVRAWRKLAAQGVLPPGVALSVTGMDAYVLVDGHDRLVASLAERRPFALLLLEHEGTRRPPSEAAAKEEAEYFGTLRARLEREMELARANGAGPLALQKIDDAYVRLWDDPWRRMRSTCAPLPGGAARWESEVRARLGEVEYVDAEGVRRDHPMLRDALPTR